MNIKVYGNELPNEVYQDLLNEGYTQEQITQELLESLCYYDYQDGL